MRQPAFAGLPPISLVERQQINRSTNAPAYRTRRVGLAIRGIFPRGFPLWICYPSSYRWLIGGGYGRTAG